MKKKLIALVLMLALVLTFGLVACGGETGNSKFAAGTYTAYGAVHNVYLGVAEVTVDENGAITDVTMDEYFLPHSYAGADATATHLEIDGRVFEKQDADTFVWNDINGSNGAGRATKNTAFKQVSGEPIPGYVSNCTDLAKAVLMNETVAEWYIRAIGDGTGMKFGTYAGTTFTAGTKTAADYASGVKKSEGKYWAPGGSYPLGWIGNMEALQNAFKNYYTAGASLGVSNKGQAPNGEWVLTLNGTQISTGATANDFHQYWAVCVKAYAKAMSASGLIF